MSDYVNHEMQDAPFEDELAGLDWGQLQEEVMSEPWLKFDDFNWSAWDQGAEAPPGDRQPERTMGSTSPTVSQSPAPVGQDVPALLSPEKRHLCQVAGCNKTFKRRAELRRHTLTHEGKMDYPCFAVGCKRTGSRAFTRLDKLKAHVLAGHDEDDLVECDRVDCGAKLPRDLFALHTEYFYHQHTIRNVYGSVREIRKCPIPKCPFQINLHENHFPSRLPHLLKKLQAHLLEKHDANRRANNAGLLKQAGYDSVTAEVICPVCPSNDRFARHEDFYTHYFRHHLMGPPCEDHTGGSNTCASSCDRHRLRSSSVIPEEVRQHRRTILSLWPDFGQSQVWDDIKCRGQWA